jgi:hypothetical protein
MREIACAFIGVIMSYPKQKLFEALHSLVGCGELDARLASAGNVLSVLKPGDFPQEYQKAFSDIKGRLFQIPPSSEGGYARRPISEDDLSRLAEDILSLFTVLIGGPSWPESPAEIRA